MARPVYDVVVIGAGPAGNICAHLTAKAGLSTLVLEEHEAAGLFVNCTGIIGVEAFERLNLPRDPLLNSLQAITFISPSGLSFRYDPGHPLAHIVSRLKFDQALADAALSEGVEYRYSSHVRWIHVDRDCVVLREREDDPFPIEAQVAVIATGFGSNLPLQVGLQGPKEIVYGAQAEVEMEGLEDVEIYLGRSVAPEAFAWVVPLSATLATTMGESATSCVGSCSQEAGRARVGLTAPKEALTYFQNFLENPAIRPRIRTQKPTMLLSPIPVTPIDRSYTDRVLVVGEAAGQVKTTTQGGIYYGMLCATFAAEAIEIAFKKKDFGARVLRRYEHQWMKSIGPELKTGWALRQLFAHLTDTQIDALVELGARDDMMSLVKRLAHFDWHKELIQTSLKWPALQEVAKTGFW